MESGPTRAALDAVYARFNSSELVGTDPLGLVDRALPDCDFEIVSFLFAGLSYGRVEQIQKSSAVLLRRLSQIGMANSGAGIANYLRESTAARERELDRALHGWVHRMNTAEDLKTLFRVLAAILKRHASLGQLFALGFATEAKTQIENFCRALQTEAQNLGRGSRRKTGKWKGTGPEWFFCSPAGGGTSKRLMMWLRWMIRSDEVDPGVWQRLLPKSPAISTSRLFLPVDTHIFAWARQNQIISRRSPNWQAVEEITDFFRKLNPADPVKYDFAICHSGMHLHRTRSDQRNAEMLTL